MAKTREQIVTEEAKSGYGYLLAIVALFTSPLVYALLGSPFSGGISLQLLALTLVYIELMTSARPFNAWKMARRDLC